MQTYQVNIYDRNYTSWELYNLESNSTTEKAELLNPLTNKLFDGDTIEIVDNHVIKVSGLNNNHQLECVLILEGNKTFFWVQAFHMGYTSKKINVYALFFILHFLFQ